MKVLGREKVSFYIAIVVFVVFTAVFLLRELYYPIKETLVYDNLVYEGVLVNDIPLDSMSFEEAVKKLNDVFNEPLKGKKVCFNIGNNVVYEKLERFKIKYDVQEASNNACSYGKKDNDIFYRTVNRYRIKRKEHNIPLFLKVDLKSIESFSNQIAIDIYKEPENACVKFNNDFIEITKEKNGIMVNKKEFVEDIKESFLNMRFDVTVPLITVKPKITSEMLAGEIKLHSSFSTPLLSKNQDRTNNIRIAAENVSGTILLPGEVFSANKSIGPRTVEAGYKNAPIFVSGKVVPGLAGGICQLVTTLYNAALEGDMEIVERKRHGQPVSYVKGGRDATIAGDKVDLKFKNKLQYPAYIETYVRDNKVTVNIYLIKSCMAQNNN